jgi:UDP-N-acetylglucosamine--N-acetylmuramyl-(pentapeptide) pyrophosphoryl-undecaprenol N-acetylglucosamine transferase
MSEQSSSVSDIRRLKILMAAGGTGGHILPAVATGRALAASYGADVFYLCGERPIELELYRSHGVEPVVFPARQLGSGLLSKLRGAAGAGTMTARCMAFIRHNAIDAVVGLGGYVAGPAVLAGILARRPTIIHEANAVPGKTNRWLAPWVDLTAVNFPSTCRLLRARRCLAVGMPIRQDVLGGDRLEACREFGLDPAKRTLLVLGGSQGARYLYRALVASLSELDAPDLHDVQLLWSTGRDNFLELSESIGALQLRYLDVRLQPFIVRMDLALACADAAVSRAGASTIAELLAAGVYALYIPLPSAIYDHQRLNAEELVRAGLGEILPEKEMAPPRTAAAVRSVLSSASARREAVKRAGQAHIEAARRLAEEITRLARPSDLPHS